VLGMQRAWPKWRNDRDDVFHKDTLKDLSRWEEIAARVVLDPPIQARQVFIRREPKTAETIVANHSSFDNNIDAVNQAIARVLGQSKPKQPITDLRGF
jgi:hypothetical protein